MPVHCEVLGSIGRLVLDRPSRAHAYDRAHLLALRDHHADLVTRVPVIVISSTGDRAFCGGADLKALGAAAPEDALDLLSQAVFTQIARGAALTIAAVQGAAVAGGCELALACDLRVVGPNARFSLPETSLGIIPSAGGTTRLTRLVGPSVAKQVILFGRTLSAAQSVQFGLAMGPEADPRAAAVAIAERVAGERDPVACRLARQIIDRAEDRSSLEQERVAEALLYARRDARA